MIISLIAALDENRGIGWKNQLPWHLPADLARFKDQTMGHTLIAGRKTYQSIGAALPGRKMIVLSRDPDFSTEDTLLARSMDDALQLARDMEAREVFVIGGAEIYQEALPLADYLYLSHVHGVFEADVFFPELDPLDWDICEEEYFPEDELNEFPHTYISYRHKRDY